VDEAIPVPIAADSSHHPHMYERGENLGSQSYSIWIAAPPGTVYDLYTDLDRIDEWQEGNLKSRTSPGTQETNRVPATSRAEVDLRAGSRLWPPIGRDTHVVSFGGPAGLRAELKAEFASRNGGTQLTLGLDARWRSPLVGRILEMAVFNPRIAKEGAGQAQGIG
jgi:hypothetical protein